MGVHYEVRRFNSYGRDQFVSAVRKADSGILDSVDEILGDPSCYEQVVGLDNKSIQIEVEYFGRRREHAEHLWKWFGPSQPLSHLVGDRYLWDWLSARWMRVLVENSGESLQSVIGKEDRWILADSTLRYHRHLVSGPLFAYQMNSVAPDNAMCLLATPVHQPGEVVERIAGKRKLSIGSVCHLATLLYFDPATGKLRSGHTSGPGKPRNLSYFFSQLDVNIDYAGLTVDELLDLLPSKFAKWVKIAKHGRSRS